MDPTQNVPAASPDSLHTMPEVTGIQSHLDAIKDQKSEAASVAMELPGTSVQAAQAAASAAHDANAPAAPPPISDMPAPAASPAGTPAVADDNDLIEQEWVTRAKAIVDSTKEDPYLQNQEINKFKADYIKKRYKRDIKVSEA